MKNGRKISVIGLGILIGAGVLVSFTGKKDNEKMKRYRVIQHAEDKMAVYDTLLPMSSTYTVENFLQDKGIDSKGVKIINISADKDHGKHEMHHKIIKMQNHEIIKEGEEGKEVKIICEMGEDGKMKMQKFVDGKEVELTPEEMEKIKMHQEMKGDHHRIMKIEMDGEHEGNASMGHHKEIKIVHVDGEEGKEVKIICEKGEDGNMKVKKIVDGKEVELSQDELDKMKKHHEMMKEHHQLMEIEMGEMKDGEPRLEHRKEMKFISIEEEDGKEVKMIHEMGEDGKMKVQKFVDGKEVELSPEELEKMKKHHEMGVEHHKMMKMEHHKMMMEEGADFTIVLVTENIDATEAKSGVTNTNDLKIYPNPNEGTFTLNFDQKEKAKTTIRIIDAQGKEVFQEDLGTFSGKYKKEIDLKQFGAGVYLINVQKGDQLTTEKVIVK